MYVPGETVIIEPIHPWGRSTLHQRRPERIVVIMLEKAFVISPDVVVIMAVKTLAVGYKCGELVSDRVARCVFGNGFVSSLVAP
jgi:hypothetical protein